MTCRAHSRTSDRALARIHDVAQSDQQTLGFNLSVRVKGMRGQILAMMARLDRSAAIARRVDCKR